METPIFAYTLTVTASFYAVSFLQAFLHYRIAHRRLGRCVFRDHVTCHHTNYRKDALVSERYIADEKNLTPLYAIPAAGLLWGAYLVLPMDLFAVHFGTVVFAFAVHVYLHTRYHATDSWLMRFRWFRCNRELHFVHHRDLRTNFAIVHFFWDRVFGTFRETIPGTEPERRVA